MTPGDGADDKPPPLEYRSRNADEPDGTWMRVSGGLLLLIGAGLGAVTPFVAYVGMGEAGAGHGSYSTLELAGWLAGATVASLVVGALMYASGKYGPGDGPGAGG